MNSVAAGVPGTTPEQPSVFLSYNSADKDYVRKLAAALAVAGAQVWFDEWKIRPGDSVPGAIDNGLSKFEIFALVWSEAASKSRWVKTEMEAAIARWTRDLSVRLVPVRLDGTPLPALLQPLSYVDGTDHDQLRAARNLLGIESETAYRLAVQDFIEEAGIEFREFWGAGVYVACPKCGASADNLEGWHQIDPKRGDEYVGVRCKVCDWSDGSEI